MKILFDTNIYKDSKSLRSNNGNIVGRVLSKEVEYSDDEVLSVLEKEALRIIECFEVINKDIKIEIDIRYLSTISRTWASLSTVRNFK